MEVFETPGDVSLQVRIPSGRVVVGTTDAPRTEVEVVPIGRRGEEAAEQIRVEHQERGGRHVVIVEQRNRIEWGPIQISWGGDVEVRVNCPVGTELELNGASTEFRAEGQYGRVSAPNRLRRRVARRGQREARGQDRERRRQPRASRGRRLVAPDGLGGRRDRPCRGRPDAQDGVRRRGSRHHPRPGRRLDDVG